VSEVGAALETTRLFIEAFNARDVETLRAAVTEDVDPRTPQGAALRGYEGVDHVVRAAPELLLVRQGAERVEEDAGVTRVSVPLRELVRKGELQGRRSSSPRRADRGVRGCSGGLALPGRHRAT